MTALWSRLAREGPAGLGQRCAYSVLRIMAALYALALRLRRVAYRLALARQYRSGAFVVSVGNLTLGGTGKTSFVAALARRLRDSGCRVVVLSRGYGRRGRPVERIASDGKELRAGPQEVGDEAVLLGRQLSGVPILVGRDRVRLAAQAVREFGAQVILLDDGMQYLRLHRDVEIILVDASRPQDLRALFPAGLLREPLSELRRGHLVCLTRVNAAVAESLQAVRRQIGSLIPKDRGEPPGQVGAPAPGRARGVRAGARHSPAGLPAMAEAVHRPAYCYRLGQRTHLPVQELAHRRAMLFCSIGNPQAFGATVRQIPMAVTSLVEFPDHHLFSRKELEGIRARAMADGAEVVTTEKDAVKLAGMEEAADFWVLGVEFELVEGQERLDALMVGCRKRGEGSGVGHVGSGALRK